MRFRDFQVGRPIGQGGFGEVLRCKSKKNSIEVDQNELEAVKLIPKRKKSSIQAEVHVSCAAYF